MILENSNHNRIIVGVVIIGVIILAVYLGTSVFFINRFYLGSTINCVSVSGKTVNEAYDEIISNAKNYELKIKGRDGFNETISGEDINLIYNDDTEVQKIKESQNPFKWIISGFCSNNYKSSEMVSFDVDKLNNNINKFSCFNADGVEEPKNPILQYEEGKYSILKETYGNKLNKEHVTTAITNAIESGKTNIDLDEEECYDSPKFTSESKEITDAKDILDKYVSTKITYHIGDTQEVLDGDKIRDFLDVDEDYNVSVSEEKIRSYLKSFAEKYNTIGKTRKFNTTGGSTISVSGGDYGRKIDVSEEVKYILDAIKDGKTDNREPKYSQVPFCNGTDDIGNTYVEVSLSSQHLWFYKDGSLIIDGPIVSGNVSNGCGTPGGVYKLEYKERNATLKGEGYSTPVSFWMPFNGGIGIHDATWRSSFGGNIYVAGGSHGCVNAPYSLANTIFNNIDSGTPVVCYY
ncbi:L,D-transpeptidase family protein [Clostridium butyricum]|uniref:Peptidoglycan-binding protein n=1 Tax=Clostridium butyricum TaxID=1492 RepID=A0AAP9RGN4_CLOBU|nr:peptidoglycan binding domain-containing protein [Clostridium butyricum]ENZ31380.1 hypothetical protein HMPREF1084_02899 [Clostridium butyricum 60E.3]MBZ5745287.1 L,D-transpeptidase/peptidoglycan binding protein [Clostridium butyricum]MCQ2014091.1 L,D-transpeptidase/peptidoglycan binding protein [Clostridium butyricum]MCQ2018456.1 L,D-transpeptidase/peptidoglycan binding protein [Clostridium butyricum]MCQ2022137.1 L,D-transpeptidase/peptidoglycan binding protein [Clostridium butyricum]